MERTQNFPSASRGRDVERVHSWLVFALVAFLFTLAGVAVGRHIAMKFEQRSEFKQYRVYCEAYKKRDPLFEFLKSRLYAASTKVPRDWLVGCADYGPVDNRIQETFDGGKEQLDSAENYRYYLNHINK